MTYTIALLFDPTGSHVLLGRKAHPPFAGLLNGVYGKTFKGESSEDGTRRVVEEETGITDINRLTWLGRVVLPKVGARGKAPSYTLNFYAGIAESVPALGTDLEEMVSWYSTAWVVTQPIGCDELAGNGDVQYFVNAGFKRLFLSDC